MTNCYIYNLPTSDYLNLVKILNSGDAWRELGGYHLGYTVIELDEFASWIHKRSGSPADAMLKDWGRSNRTTKELFKHLQNMGHYQAMDAIKNHVPEKYHSALRPPQNSTTVLKQIIPKRIGITNSALANALPKPPIAKPPIAFGLDQPSMASNLNYDIDKSYQKEIRNVYEDTEDTHSSNDQFGHSPNLIKAKTNLASSHNSRLSPHRQTSMGASESSHGKSMTLISRMRRVSERDKALSLSSEIRLPSIPFQDLYESCHGFSQGQHNQHNFLGKGGFGEVYRGTWLGQEVAVKKLRKERLEEICINSFIQEIIIMHQFPAENILRLLGVSYSVDMSTDPCLVYQYMPNGSLSDRLRRKNGTPALTWDQRANIAWGTVKALRYLHAKTPEKPDIIHGDIKPANILLDQHFEARIGDFGLARGGTVDPSKTSRTVSHIHGTSHYLPADYVRDRKLSPMVDIFCLGITFLEILTGKSPSHKVHVDENDKRGRDMRSILLDEELTEYLPWVDKHTESSDYWEGIFFHVGRDCAKERRKLRPNIVSIYELFERVWVQYNVREKKKKMATNHISEAMKLQMYYDQKNREQDNQNLGATALPILPNVIPNFAGLDIKEDESSLKDIKVPNEEKPASKSPDIPLCLLPGSEKETSDGIPIVILSDEKVSGSEKVEAESNGIPALDILMTNQETSDEFSYSESFVSDIEGLASSTGYLRDMISRNIEEFTSLKQ